MSLTCVESARTPSQPEHVEPVTMRENRLAHNEMCGYGDSGEGDRG